MRVEFTSALNETKRLETSNTNQSSSFSIAHRIQDNQSDFLGQVSFLSLHSCANHIPVHLARFTSNSEIFHLFRFSSYFSIRLFIPASCLTVNYIYILGVRYLSASYLLSDLHGLNWVSVPASSWWVCCLFVCFVLFFASLQ